MPRSSNQTIAEIIGEVVTHAVAGVTARIRRDLGAAAVQARRADAARRGGRTGRRPHGRVRRKNLTNWTADNRARRVPKFVIEMTDLDTKKKIVAKFGDGATFQKGKPLPAPVSGKAARKEEAAASIVRAKPPVVRKAAKA